MNLHKFERTETLAVFGGSILAALDGFFYYMNWQVAHEYLIAFLVGTAAVGSVTLLIRWHRQEHELLNKVHYSKDEILAAGQRSKQETLDAVQLSKHEMLAAIQLSELVTQGNEVAKHLKEVINDYRDVREKKFPDFTDKFLARELGIFQEKLQHLRSGSIRCDLEFGQTLSPDFFLIWEGKCFVTSYGPWKYWNSDEGTRQLQANRKRIDDRKGDIIRYFVLCRHGALPDDDIIDKHINAGIKVRVIEEDHVPKKYRRDVGVFFKNEKVVFLSMWGSDTRDGEQPIAKLLFSGEEFQLAEPIYRHFTGSGDAEQITDIEHWRHYKSRYLTADS